MEYRERLPFSTFREHPWILDFTTLTFAIYGAFIQVRNTGQATDNRRTFDNDVAQAFTTGSGHRLQADPRGPQSAEYRNPAELQREHPLGVVRQSGQQPGHADESGLAGLRSALHVHGPGVRHQPGR